MDVNAFPPTLTRPTRSDLHKAALEYAKRGWPVFPLHHIDEHGMCSCGGPEVNEKCTPGKHPRTRHGHLDASTDPSRITAWWNHFPHANIGVVTGERSGLLVLDVDHPAALDALEDEHGALLATRTHATGGGGMHYIYRYPEGEDIRNNVKKLGEDLDVRGEGGYVAAPPSRTTRPYQLLDALPIAEPPEWLLERLRRRPPERKASAPGEDVVSIDVAGPPIPEGTRNDALASIAGKLHDGTRDLDELTRDLFAINERRCSPALPEDEVAGIARSIFRGEPCRKKAPEVSPEVLETLQALEAENLWGREWRGKGGKSERSVFVALIKAGRAYGELIPAGVRVSIDIRNLALASGLGKRALLDTKRGGELRPGVITRLKTAGLIRCDNHGRAGAKAGAFVLLTSPAQMCTTPPTRVSTGATEYSYGAHLRAPRNAPLSAPRLRHSPPGGKPRRGLVRETRKVRSLPPGYRRKALRLLGKVCEQIVDTLEATGGTLPEPDLAATLGIKRPRDLRRRYLARLEAAAVVECFEGNVSLTGDWLIALDRERENSGEKDAERRDRARYEKEREAYLNRHNIKPDPVPEKPPAGEIWELRPAPEPDPELVAALERYLYLNPHRIGEPAGWFAVTLWANELVQEKPHRLAVEDALAEILNGTAA